MPYSGDAHLVKGYKPVARIHLVKSLRTGFYFYQSYYPSQGLYANVLCMMESRPSVLFIQRPSDHWMVIMLPWGSCSVYSLWIP